MLVGLVESGELHFWRVFGGIEALVGHHGCANLTEADFLSLLQGRIAVVTRV